MSWPVWLQLIVGTAGAFGCWLLGYVNGLIRGRQLAWKRVAEIVCVPPEQE